MLLLFYVVIFGQEAYGILVPQSGIKFISPALEGEFLTTGSPGKSTNWFFNHNEYWHSA